MRRPRIAINTAMFTSSIRIEARLEAHIRAIVPGDDATRLVGQIFRRRPTEGIEIFLVVLDLLKLELVVRRLKAIRRVEPGAAASRRRCAWTIHVVFTL